ncbi:uncharacterized protein LOC142340646 [Convolutriloba macropyga]|uniref:uncharacterized protein LOC142340646 n=1 Tax=Convolutriloba macropyga TaxID=536237 RepID=UPI003F51F567
MRMLAESAFGRNSSQLTFVRSLYTAEVTMTYSITSHSVESNVVFDSGVGAFVGLEIDCLDSPLSLKKMETFRLSLEFNFGIIPGSAYVWNITSTSRGSNPLQRVYSFSDTSPPVRPVSLVTAAATLLHYDVFTLTVGNRPYTERSTSTLQFTWAQERRIEEYLIRDVNLDRQMPHIVSTAGWTFNYSTGLVPGAKYSYEITSLSHGLQSSDVMTVEDSTYPLPPIENEAARIVDGSSITLFVQYTGFVQPQHLVHRPGHQQQHEQQRFNLVDQNEIFTMTGKSPDRLWKTADYRMSGQLKRLENEQAEFLNKHLMDTLLM